MEKIKFTFRTEKVNGENIRILSPSRRMTEEEVKRSNKRIGKIIDKIITRMTPEELKSLDNFIEDEKI